MTPSPIKKWLKSQAFSAENRLYIEDLFHAFLQNPTSVDTSWQQIFSEILSTPTAHPTPNTPTQGDNALALFQYQEAFRRKGHLGANTNPLATLKALPDFLQWQHYGFKASELNQVIQGNLTLRQLEKTLIENYCGTLSAEFAHLDASQKAWFERELEGEKQKFSPQEKRQFLQCLVKAEGLERYLGRRFAGAKRFSLEGCESFILFIQSLIKDAREAGIEEMTFGMAHRGRLNMLINIFAKPQGDLFDEFLGKNETQGSGDVKYHQGFTTNWRWDSQKIRLTLLPNPSHLEIISPVVQGAVRARQDALKNGKEKVLGVSIHGDSALAGQGVVQETLNMSKVRGFEVGGMIRIVINNQIGFTTHRTDDTRSMTSATDVAKMIQAPVLHVNADDPEAVVRASQLALRYRQAFKQDIFIDLVGYRRHGHNEADDPTLTQPLMYQQIHAHPTITRLYGEKLQKEGVIEEDFLSEIEENYRHALDENEKVVLEAESVEKHFPKENPLPALDVNSFRQLGEKLSQVPSDFHLHPRLAKLYADRTQMARGEKPLDWGMAELLAYASILKAGKNVRLAGEDVGRATFSHRNARLHDQKTAQTYLPLRHLGEGQGAFWLWDSVLSEEAVLAFEYGYAGEALDTLTLWEAQFGDFANGAQVVIDQFISSGEQKWGNHNALTLLLPHGYEGQGPEHSSARLERYLQLCSEENMCVAIPTTPAQIFHLLRRQASFCPRKPLVVMTPKSLLRHPLAVSYREAFIGGEFAKVMGEENVEVDKITRLIFCAGKVYYDLVQQRQALTLSHIALVRLEQLYPYPKAEIGEILARYPHLTEVIWCQEEPQNQGAWQFIAPRLQKMLKGNLNLRYAGRKSMAATATGNANRHKAEQAQLLTEALT